LITVPIGLWIDRISPFWEFPVLQERFYHKEARLYVQKLFLPRNILCQTLHFLHYIELFEDHQKCDGFEFLRVCLLHLCTRIPFNHVFKNNFQWTIRFHFRSTKSALHRGTKYIQEHPNDFDPYTTSHNSLITTSYHPKSTTINTDASIMSLQTFLTELLHEKGAESAVLARDDPSSPSERKPRHRAHPSGRQQHNEFRFESSPGSEQRSVPPKCPRRMKSMDSLSPEAKVICSNRWRSTLMLSKVSSLTLDSAASVQEAT
jgi:hypothetical protein